MDSGTPSVGVTNSSRCLSEITRLVASGNNYNSLQFSALWPPPPPSALGEPLHWIPTYLLLWLASVETHLLCKVSVRRVMLLMVISHAVRVWVILNGGSKCAEQQWSNCRWPWCKRVQINRSSGGAVHVNRCTVIPAGFQSKCNLSLLGKKEEEIGQSGWKLD